MNRVLRNLNEKVLYRSDADNFLIVKHPDFDGEQEAYQVYHSLGTCRLASEELNELGNLIQLVIEDNCTQSQEPESEDDMPF